MTHEIELDLQPNGQGSIKVGGVDISGHVAAGSISVIQPIPGAPKVYIALQGRDAAVRVLGDLVVEMPPDFRKLLLVAGWTPPEVTE